MAELTARAAAIGARLAGLKAREAYVRAFGFRPATVIDVGVHTGTPWLYGAFADRRFELIDPTAEAEEAAAAWAARIDCGFHRCALGAEDGVLTLRTPLRGGKRLGNMASLSPRSAENRAGQGLTDMEETAVPVRRLDALAARWQAPFGIKIDTEGSELAVLAGGAETLRQAEFVILEVSIARRFEGGYRFSEAIAAMAAAGFEVREFLSGFGPRPLFADILFTPV